MVKAPSAKPRKPSEVSPERRRFDEFAARVIDFASRGRFLVLVLVGLATWMGFGFRARFSVHWYEWGGVTIAWLTLMLVFAVENSHRRSDQAIQHKLNAIANALADFMDEQHVPDEHTEELRSAVGLERRESVD